MTYKEIMAKKKLQGHKHLGSINELPYCCFITISKREKVVKDKIYLGEKLNKKRGVKGNKISSYYSTALKYNCLKVGNKLYLPVGNKTMNINAKGIEEITLYEVIPEYANEKLIKLFNEFQ